jgi:hypothetical protein
MKKYSIIIIPLLFICYAAYDFIGPNEIPLESVIVLNVKGYRASDLVVHRMDKDGCILATRGFNVYRLCMNSNKFEWQYHIPTGLSAYWILNFKILRYLVNSFECNLILPIEDKACIFSGEKIWHYDGNAFMATINLPNAGVGSGGGIFPNGLDLLPDGSILFGEYFGNKNRIPVRLLSSMDSGRSWFTSHEFSAGSIRHIHAVQYDPYSHKTWILTGDLDHECLIAWTLDGKSFTPIGQGEQKWRATQLAFTEQYIYWGADTGMSEASGIYRYDRTSQTVKKLAQVDGCVFYATRLADGSIIMSTDREGTRNERDDKTRFYLIRGDDVYTTIWGSWVDKRKFAKIRILKNQGVNSLVFTSLNNEEYGKADLFIIDIDQLHKIDWKKL